MAGRSADSLLADKGYDAHAIGNQARQLGMAPVIPPKKNRKTQRQYDQALHKLV